MLPRSVHRADDRDGTATRSAIAGRVRVDVPSLFDRPGRARDVARRLRSEPGIVEAVANAATGRVLVYYEPPRTQGDVERLIAEVVRSVTKLAAKPAGESVVGLRFPFGLRPSAGMRTVALGAVAAFGLIGVGLRHRGAVAVAVLAAAALAASQLRRNDDAADHRERVVQWLEAELRPYRGRLLAAAALGAAGAGFSLARFGLIAAAIDTGAVGGPRLGPLLGRFAILGASVMAASWASSICEYQAQRQWRRVSQDLQHDLRLRLYDRLQRSDLAVLREGEQTLLASVAADDTNRLDSLFEAGWELYKIGVGGIGIVAALAALNPGLAGLGLIGIPLIVEALLALQERFSPRYAAVRDAAAPLQTRMSTNLANLPILKALGAETDELRRIAGLSETYRHRQEAASSVAAAFVPVLETAVMAGLTLSLVGAGLLTRHGLSPGSYTAAVMLTRQLLWPVAQMGALLESSERSLASAGKVMMALATPVEQDGQGIALPAAAVRGAIRFDALRYGYRVDDPALNDLTLDIPAGAVTAVVGPTGAGKSTLVQLLLRFRDPQSGTVLLDGRDIATIRRTDLRRCCAVVPQEVFLIDSSVRHNIALGYPAATQDEIEQAAQLAGCHDLIMRLPDGYDTDLGLLGTRLSGGQRQQISLARAILRRAPILILDEATSQLDNETEAQLLTRLLPALAGRTTLVITHRLRAARHADRIHVLDRGRLVESGDHQGLLADGGLYAALWHAQIDATPQPSVPVP